MRVNKAFLLLLYLLPLTVNAVEQEPPSMELLEYLGNWEDSNGNWIDPQMLEPTAMRVAESENETANKDDDE